MLLSLRAIIWLRWRLLANAVRSGKRRDRLEQVSRAFALFIPIIVIALLTGSVIAMTALGFMSGRASVAGTVRPELVVVFARLLLAVMMVVLFILTVSAPSQTTISKYSRLLLLPIPRGALHLVEVVANLADPWIVLVAAALLALPAGIAAGGDFLAASVTLAAGLIMLMALAAFGALISFVVGWIFRSRRRSEMFTLVAVGLLTLISLLPMLFTTRLENKRREARRAGEPRPRVTIESFDASLPRWTRALPSELYGRTVLRGYAGDAVGAGVGLAALAGQAIVLFLASSVVHRRMLGSLEGTSRRRRAVEQPMASLPGLAAFPRVGAVAWAQVRTALRTVRGRLVVLMPGPMLAILTAIFSRISNEEWTSQITNHGPLLFGAGIVFGLYSLQSFSMNLFGADRAGLTLQLLAPIRDRELAWGKVIGCGLIYAVASGASLMASLAVAAGGSPFTWLTVALGGVATYLLLSPLSVWLSTLFPLASDLSKTGSGGNPHPFPMFVGTFVVLIFAAPAALIAALSSFGRMRPVLAFALMAGWTLLTIAISIPTVNLAARSISLRRENLALTAQGR